MARTFYVLTLLIALATLTTVAFAQGRTIYSNDGNVVGRYTTDRQGTTTLYDRNGRVISRANLQPPH
jgi:YD repeat-containing protein